MFKKYLLFFTFISVVLLSYCPDNDTIKTESLIPTPQSVSAQSNAELEITWENPENQEIEGLILSRKIGEEEWDDNYRELPSGVTNYTDSLEIVLNIIISYRLRAFTLNDTSDYSDIMAYFGSETMPSNFSGKQIDSENILLTWTDNSIGEESFVLDKKTGSKDWILSYKAITANLTEYIDKAASSDSISYRISAVSGKSSSQYSAGIALKLGSLSLDNLYFGSDQTLEILTWNVQNFPRKNGDTIISLAQAINALHVDIIALQEIESNSDFNTLIDSLDNYQGFRANSAYADLDLAYLYNTKYVTVDSIYEIYSREYSAFPRRPLVLHCRWQNIPVIIINNHFKCCGDGVINRNDDDDEEYRRFRASELLVSYIQDHFANDRVIIVGDFNDEITDYQNNNVFQPFINQSTDFIITDINIANGSSTQWSYPAWPSHLDHIIISNELFDEFTGSNTTVQTLLIDQYFSSGWNGYALTISDHRPVGLKLRFSNTVY
ncbi:endonuclease/exonuclease/phosphatase family protein [bacterium]|nr:endonuclease/exonuclease/phosphatase family protein [bacterium]MBU1634310.1 endonuclease/exonuclease/phosphatase family protein [bacterium]MBU1874588.1 endonuclease/exonuclease/phosphatase family protein [bacterium]